MPGRNDAFTAARFQLTIDGHEVGRFETLFAAVAPGGPQRAFQVHELPLLWQHAGEFGPGKVAQSDPHFDLPSASGPPWRRPSSTIVLKRGTGSRASLARWQNHGGSVTLVALGAAGQPVGHYPLSHAWVVKIEGPSMNAKGGSDIAMEEIVIAHEGG
jgi:hypothetical protein